MLSQLSRQIKPGIKPLKDLESFGFAFCNSVKKMMELVYTIPRKKKRVLVRVSYVHKPVLLGWSSSSIPQYDDHQPHAPWCCALESGFT